MMVFENIQIQLIDTPALAPQSTEFWLPHMLRRADSLLIMVDLSEAPLAQMEAITAELAEMRIELSASSTQEKDSILSQQKALVAGNKSDLPGARENYQALYRNYGKQLPMIAISARAGAGLEELRAGIFRMLDIIRVYTKTPGKKADLTDPIILKRGSTLEDAAASVHKDFRQRLRYARIWGSGKHDGIMARRDHVVEDGDIIELHL